METMEQIIELEIGVRKETAEFRLNCQNQLLKQLRNIEPADEKARKHLQDAIETTIKSSVTAENDLKMLELFSSIFQKKSTEDGGLESLR